MWKVETIYMKCDSNLVQGTLKRPSWDLRNCVVYFYLVQHLLNNRCYMTHPNGSSTSQTLYWLRFWLTEKELILTCPTWSHHHFTYGHGHQQQLIGIHGTLPKLLYGCSHDYRVCWQRPSTQCHCRAKRKPAFKLTANHHNRKTLFSCCITFHLWCHQRVGRYCWSLYICYCHIGFHRCSRYSWLTLGRILFLYYFRQVCSQCCFYYCFGKAKAIPNNIDIDNNHYIIFMGTL